MPGIVKNIGFGAVYAASSLVALAADRPAPRLHPRRGHALAARPRADAGLPARHLAVGRRLRRARAGAGLAVQPRRRDRAGRSSTSCSGCRSSGWPSRATWLVVRRVPVARLPSLSRGRRAAARAPSPRPRARGSARRRQRVRADPSPPRTGLSRTCSSSSLSGTVTNSSSSPASSVSSRLGAIGRSSRMMQTSAVSAGQLHARRPSTRPRASRAAG